MGYPYNELIPPAILFNNPGITRNEFVSLLDQTHSSPGYVEISKKDPWNSYKFETGDYHRDNWGLANILGVRHTEAYKTFLQPEKDLNGLLLDNPRFRIIDSETPNSQEINFEIITHIENIIQTPKTIEIGSNHKMRIGEIYQINYIKKSLITKIIEYNENREGDEDDFYFESFDDFRYTFRVRVIPISLKYKREIFLDKTELLNTHPYFDYDFMYDFNQKQGNFEGCNCTNFCWLRKGDRYYFDEETFNQIPAGKKLTQHNYGYTDLIMTNQAILNQSWKLLSRCGLNHFDDFIRDFSQAKEVYKKAVWDSHTSLFAKEKGMSNFDLIRIRILGNAYWS